MFLPIGLTVFNGLLAGGSEHVKCRRLAEAKAKLNFLPLDNQYIFKESV
jgi:hypothetical protein